MLQGPGENAGVVDLGDGQAVTFKVESHNHPSAVEPFQGAATGVGGILRDILAMGARPIAFLDGLRFGSPDHRFERAVEGIGHYGNSCGVATVGGEAVFDPAYEDNCLVNAMCVGLLPVDRLTRAGARGTGNALVLYGATTGRDGIGGASVLASQELGEGAVEKRPSVQIGDPFTGKKLIEASGELVERGLVESLQDCGAAGLASSLSEMAREAGIDVHLDRVPLREADLEPWEVMISESQERMVAVVRPERLDQVAEVCRRWELAHAVIGEVTDTGELRCFHEDDLLAAIPARTLTEDAPRYRVEQRAREPQPPAPPVAGPPLAQALAELLASPNLRSRAWIYRRYDHLVGSRTVRRPGLDAAVLRLDGTRGLAVSLDGTGRIGRARPAHRRRARGARGRPQRRLRRRRAARRHRLPQLRQPGEARDRLGARRVDRGHGPGVRGARHPGRVRERVALQRDGRAADPPHAGRRLRRARRGRERRPRRVARGRRRVPRRRARADARRLRVPGAVRRARRPPGAHRSRRRGAPDRLPPPRRAALLARPRRRRGRAWPSALRKRLP